MAPACTVLLLDDDYQLLHAIQSAHLRIGPGWKLTTLDDPTQAMDLLDDPTLALLITDLSMPEMEGLAVIAGAQQRAPNLPIAVITGKDEKDAHVSAASELGVIGILNKPFCADEFFAFVESLLLKKKAS